MERWVEEWLDEQRREGKRRIEIKKFGRGYYVYESTSVWDKSKKRVRKVSKYKGRLTREGLVIREKKANIRSIYEYGNSSLLYYLIQPLLNPLKNAFPGHYQEIIAMGVVKAIEPQPIKLVASRWEKLHLSRLMTPSLSPNSLADVLKEVGSDITHQSNFFNEIIRKNKFLLFDLSYVFSRSENLQLAEKGYNKEHLYLPQVNIAMLFSVEKRLPVMIKVLPGSVRDIKSFKKMLEEIELEGVTVVVDRGMAS
jgi:transposase